MGDIFLSKTQQATRLISFYLLGLGDVYPLFYIYILSRLINTEIQRDHPGYQ